MNRIAEIKAQIEALTAELAELEAAAPAKENVSTFVLTTGEVVELDAKWTHITECIGRDGVKHFMGSKHRNEAAAAKFLAKEATKYGFTPVAVHAAK